MNPLGFARRQARNSSLSPKLRITRLPLLAACRRSRGSAPRPPSSRRGSGIRRILWMAGVPHPPNLVDHRLQLADLLLVAHGPSVGRLSTRSIGPGAYGPAMTNMPSTWPPQPHRTIADGQADDAASTGASEQPE